MSEPTLPPPYNPPPPTAPTGNTVSPNRTIMIVLAYLGLLALIPLLVEKDDREVQWHAKHGLVLLVAEIAVWFALFVVQMVAVHIFAPLGCVLGILSIVLWIGILVLHIMCIVKGVNGNRLIIPGISQYADRF